MQNLIVRHVTDSDPAQFLVVRARDGKTANPVAVPSPYGFPVDGRPNSDLMRELRWYLEYFLDYPFPPSTNRAERVQAALQAWGQQAFEALFDSGKGVKWYAEATKNGLADLHLDVSSDDPSVLAWPWEALYDPETGWIALQCQIGRRLNAVADPLPLSEKLPKDRVNILLVTARPMREDVPYRSISRRLVELVEHGDLPASVRVLRPPTLDSLRQHLRDHPNFYHILHFDGHGGYGATAAGGPHAFKGPQGHLLFEDEEGQKHDVPAETLSTLLREHRIPAVVLNACQSGMVDEHADDPFASVAAAMLRAGVRSVVAMAYSLYVSGAQEFLPAFYSRLFETQRLATAARAGRQQMLAQPDRVCARGTFPLQDWLVPVVYEQEAFDFSFAAEAVKTDGAEKPALPQEALDAENPYGFIGRDRAVLELERAMRRPPAGILIHGLGGIGKTTLARGFVQWLRDTGGLGQGCFWFSFNDIRNAEYVLNRLGEPVFGPNFATAKTDEKLDALAGVFKENPFVIVWDNFESARGIEGTPMEPKLNEADRQVLRRLLQKLRGGKTKVLITSRSTEAWLGRENRFKLPLGGLHGEERWVYCTEIVRDLGKTVDRTDADLVRLMDLLDGHPLAMRVMLPLLEDRSAATLADALKHNLDTLGTTGDALQDKLFATLRFVEDNVPDDLRPLLTPLALHERFLDADYLEHMAKQLDDGWTRARLDRFVEILWVHSK